MPGDVLNLEGELQMGLPPQKNLVQERGHWRGYQDRNGTVNFFTELLLNYHILAETDASFERRQSNLMRIWVEVEGRCFTH